MNSGCSLSSSTGVAVGVDVVHQVVPPVVAAGLHVDVARRCGGRRRPSAPIGDFCEAVIDVRLERDDLAAPPAAVGGDDELRLGVVVAVGDGVGAEAAEDDRVRRADPGTGQHGDRQLGDHRHVDRDAVAGLDAELLQHVGELADFAMQLLIGQHAGVARLAFPDDRRLVLPPRREVPVEAVVRRR